MADMVLQDGGRGFGRQVPTQAPSLDNGGSLSGATGYSELLYAHLLDADGARLTYTHYTNRVPYRHLLDIMFNRPVYIQRNKVTLSVVTCFWSLIVRLRRNGNGGGGDTQLFSFLCCLSD